MANWVARITTAYFLLIFSAGGYADNSQGIYYECQRPGVPPSYLLGTLHVADKRVLSVADDAAPALRASRRLILEIVPDGSAAVKTLLASLLPGDSKLRDLIDKDLYDRAVAVAASRGIARHVVDRMKPWSLALTLSFPNSEGAPLDLRLFQLAEEWGVEVSGLETVAEQLSLFETLPLDEQVAFLDHVVKNGDELPKQLQALVSAYVVGDLAALEALGFEQAGQFDTKMLRWFRERVMIERNVRMARRLSDYLRDGGVFVAVGALHLVGDSGLIHAMQEAGCRLHKIR